MTTGKGGAINGAGPVTARCALRAHIQPVIIETSGLLFLRFKGQKANVVWQRGFLCTLDCAANQRCASG